MEFKDPPKKRYAPRVNWTEITEALKKKPGRWAFVKHQSYTATHFARDRGLECQLVASDSGYDLYCRWPDKKEERA